jgi:hypothetical protein
MPENHDCPYCARSFARPDYRDLHLGLDHADRLTPAERAAYEDASETEREALTLFRYKALAALVVIYFGFIMVYAFALSA